jgi:hypothetical protein
LIESIGCREEVSGRCHETGVGWDDVGRDDWTVVLLRGRRGKGVWESGILRKSGLLRRRREA